MILQKINNGYRALKSQIYGVKKGVLHMYYEEQLNEYLSNMSSINPNAIREINDWMVDVEEYQQQEKDNPFISAQMKIILDVLSGVMDI